MRFLNLTVATIVICASSSIGNVHAGIVLTGDHTLAPNQANQVIDISASPSFIGEIAAGLNLNFVVDDGGSVAGGINGNSPTITSIDLKPIGGLFSNPLITDSQSNVLSTPKLFQVTLAVTTVALRPVITPNVLLARVTLNTTGFTSGTWVLDLNGIPAVGLPSSDFAGAATTVNNGSITITAVPEPSSLMAIGVFFGVALASRRRRRGK